MDSSSSMVRLVEFRYGTGPAVTDLGVFVELSWLSHLRLKTLRLVILSHRGGMGPLIWFSFRFKSRRALSLPSSHGMEPLRAFRVSVKCSKFVSVASSLGMAPLNWL